MKLLYKKVFKNNQVTYGRPYQIKVPINLRNFTDPDDYDTDSGADDQSATASPEEQMEKARIKCDTMLKDAKNEAESIIEQAKAQAHKVAAEISEEAWQKGYAEGMEAAAEQNRAILAQAEEIKQSAAEEYETILAGMEADIIDLVMRISRKAVAGELAANREVILQLVSSALSECTEKNRAVVKVSPSDCDYLNENSDRLSVMVEGADELEIKPDNSMKPGDCIIETPLGSIDAGTGTRLDNIQQALKEEYEGR